MDPIEHLRGMLRRWKLVVVVSLIFLAAAFLTEPSKPAPTPAPKPVKEYRATAVLLASPPTAGSTTQSLANLAFITVTGDVPRRVAKTLQYDGEPTVLASQVKATSDASLNVIRISSSGVDGPATARLVNTFAKELMLLLEQTQQSLRQQQVDDAIKRMDAIQASVAERDAKAAAPGAAKVDFVKAERDALIRQYGLVYDRLQQLQALPPPTSGLTLFEEATPVPVFRNTTFTPPSRGIGRVVFGGLIGVLVAFGLALVVHRLDMHLFSKRAAESAFGLPVVAEIPYVRQRKRYRYSISTVSERTSPRALAYRQLRTSIMLMRIIRPASHHNSSGSAVTNGSGIAATNGSSGNGHGPIAAMSTYEALVGQENGRERHVFLVSSASAREGKSVTVANLAAACAEAGQSVIVLGCDFTRPTIHHFLNVDRGPGVTELLSSKWDESDMRAHTMQTSIPGVSLLVHGLRNECPEGLLLDGARLISYARAAADTVLIDTGPLLYCPEAADLAPYVDAVILVARPGRTKVTKARQTSELLSRIGAPILGTVLVGVSRRSRYYHYHDRHSGKESKRSRARKVSVAPAPPVPTSPEGLLQRENPWSVPSREVASRVSEERRAQDAVVDLTRLPPTVWRAEPQTQPAPPGSPTAPGLEAAPDAASDAVRDVPTLPAPIARPTTATKRATKTPAPTGADAFSSVRPRPVRSRSTREQTSGTDGPTDGAPPVSRPRRSSASPLPDESPGQK